MKIMADVFMTKKCDGQSFLDVESTLNRHLRIQNSRTQEIAMSKKWKDNSVQTLHSEGLFISLQIKTKDKLEKYKHKQG